jgi:hypothetical protein
MTGDIAFTSTGASGTTGTSKKITWSGSTDNASIYYTAPSADAGRLVINTGDDTNCLVAWAYKDSIKAYINNSTPSFYPATTNTGSIGLSGNKWASMYATTFYGALSGNASTATKFNSTRTIKLTGAVTGTATTDGSSGWEIATTKNHTHPVSELTWDGGVNLKTTATANNQEWSIDLTPGSYTGTYWHVWSATNSKSILCCYPDDNKVTIPSGGLQLQKFIANTGTNIAAEDKGSSASPRYFPNRWKFNLGIDSSALVSGLTIII